MIERILITLRALYDRATWNPKRPPKDTPPRIIDDCFRVLLENGSAPEAWRYLHKELSRRWQDVSNTVASQLDPNETVDLAVLLLQAISQGVLHDWNKKNKLFESGERIGVHVLPVHFYSPIPNISELPDKLWSERYEKGWDLRRPQQLALLSQLARYAGEMSSTLEKETPGRPHEYFWDNPAFNPTDALVYYCMIRNFQSKKIVEVGAGYSTMVAAKAGRKNGNTILRCIEPFPMKVLADGLSGVDRLICKRVQDVPIEEFDDLGENDILFVDSTHVSKVGSDVNHIVFKILPRLRSGVLVHFHDIFLPWNYPQSWVKEHKLFWNEAYLILALLMFNDSFEVLLANHLLGIEHQDALKASFPFAPSWGGGSLWIRKTNSK